MSTVGGTGSDMLWPHTHLQVKEAIYNKFEPQQALSKISSHETYVVFEDFRVQVVYQIPCGSCSKINGHWPDRQVSATPREVAQKGTDIQEYILVSMYTAKMYCI